jgi:hypothetical protein
MSQCIYTGLFRIKKMIETVPWDNVVYKLGYPVNPAPKIPLGTEWS